MAKRIIITGGHHNCALVVAEELRKKSFEVVWFGRQQPKVEYQEVTQAGFEFVEIKAGKSHRWWRPTNLWRLPWGFWQAWHQLRRWQPNLILSFGGYLAVPVVICGWFLGIPSITHEQTVVYGLANRVIGCFAKKVMVSWPSSLKHFPLKKAVFTGLPLRPEIFTPYQTVQGKLPTIYITGGKQGSRVINQAVEQTLAELLKNYNIIHQTGSSTISGPPKFKNRYLAKDYFFRKEIGHVLATADLVVSRAGAHTTYEMAALAKPVLFIPIPWSFANEQNKNAQRLVKAGTAEILPQDELSGKTLLAKVNQMFKNLAFYQKNANQAKKLVQLKATEKIVNLVEKMTR